MIVTKNINKELYDIREDTNPWSAEFGSRGRLIMDNVTKTLFFIQTFY